MRPILFIFMFALPYFLHAQEKELEVEGGIKIGNVEADPEPGTIRWTGSDFHGWNGTKWVSLTTGAAFENEIIDIDGNMYPTILIGSQEWMAGNLRASRFRDGTEIPQVSDSLSWIGTNFGAWCWLENDSTYDQPYGKLYNWYAVNDSRELCPEGWHVPTQFDWGTLINFLGGAEVAGGKLKEAGTAHWVSPNIGATNSSGFTALPAGIRTDEGIFSPLGHHAASWSSDVLGENAILSQLGKSSAVIQIDNNPKEFGLTVRCIKD